MILGATSGRGAIVRVVLLAFITYAYFMPQWADWNIDSRLDLVHAIVDHASLTINPFHWNTWDKAVYRGNYYSDKAPGTAFLGAATYAGFAVARSAPVLGGGIQLIERSDAWKTPIRLGLASTQKAPAPRGTNLGGCQRTGTPLNYQYIPWGNRLVPPMRDWALSKYFVTISVVGLLSALFAGFLFWFLGFFTRRPLYRWLLTGLFAVGSVALPYSTVFYSHQLVAAFLFVAFAMLFLRSRERIGRWAPVAAGFLLGLSFLTEYTVALVIIAIGLYAVWVLRGDASSILALCVAAIIPVIALFVYNFACFGSALDTGYTHDFCWSAAQAGGFAGFTYPKLGPLWDLTLGPYRGLFNMSPFLLLALPGAVIMWRRGYRIEAALCIATSALLILAISAYWGWNGGRVDGPRYLVPIVPFLAFPIVFWLEGFGSSILGWLITVGAAVWSFFATWVQFLGGEMFPISWLRNPLREYSLPQLAGNHINPNVGLFLGLSGWESLIPLVILLLVVAGWGLPMRTGLPGIWRSRRPYRNPPTPGGLR